MKLEFAEVDNPVKRPRNVEAANRCSAAPVGPVAGRDKSRVLVQGGIIRNSFAVGIIAFATLAAAGLLFRRRRPLVATPAGAEPRDAVDDLYAAGL